MKTNTLPADSREFNILFPVVDTGTTEYRKARDIADYYSEGTGNLLLGPCILVKYDETLSSYFWKPSTIHPRASAVWQKIVDIYEPVPLQQETDDTPEVRAPDDIRQRIKRQVGIAATARQLGWDEVYIIAYGLFFKRTGIHPAVESSLTGEPAHLDVVFRIPDGPKILLDCVNEILIKDLIK